MSDEDEKVLIEIETRWRAYLRRVLPSDSDMTTAMVRYRLMFPFGSPEEFEKVWERATHHAPMVGSQSDVSLPENDPALEVLPAPPWAGEALVSLFCKRDLREAVLGDLDEKFAEVAERRGAKVAKAWYWSQAGRSVLFFAVRWGRRLLELEAILKRIL